MIEEGWVLRSDDEGEGQVGVGDNQLMSQIQKR